jgi:hypothetical protein
MDIEKLIRELERRAKLTSAPIYPYQVRLDEMAAEALTTMQARLERVRSIVENGYPGQPAKIDQCKHGRFGYEDCIACYDEALLEALGASGLVP